MKLYDNEFARVKAAASRGEEWAILELQRMNKKAQESKKRKKVKAAEREAKRKADFKKWNDEKAATAWWNND